MQHIVYLSTYLSFSDTGEKAIRETNTFIACVAYDLET